MPTYTSQPIDNIDHRVIGGLARAWLARRFNSKAKCRVLIYGHADPICRSQIEPFFHHAAVFRERFGAEFRCRPIDELLTGITMEADVVLVQPWFTVGGTAIGIALEKLRTRLPNARIVFLDSYAHNDLRLARFIDPYIDLYYKKSIFRDRSAYLQPRRGDTNLTEYYSELCDVDVGEPVDWHVPTSILAKLRLSPNFLTATRFARAIQYSDMPIREGRSIDIQARLGGQGTSWYSAMRKLAQNRVEAIDGLTLSPAGHLSLKAFMAELQNSKLCFSPFGYGELCWRDIEAFQSGTALIKPDMSHLETLPDLYEPGATYFPVQWDFSDLEDVVRGALSDEAGMERVAREAWRRTAEYVSSSRFVDDMDFLA